MLMLDAGIDLERPSVGELVVRAFVDALNRFEDKPAIAYRSRTDAIAAEEAPALVVYSVDEACDGQADTLVSTRTIRVEIQGVGEAPADALLDPLYVFAVMAVSTYKPLGDLLLGCTVSKLQWDVEGGEQDAAFACVDFQLIFQTDKWNPTAQFRPQDS